ncbi:hypothetical protein VRU48_06715 [Pedobacter sp. KR3-3]|uniref:Natural product n=1 Tax=Pedobacter albus TaxID=3113905 RepID=A0ABU7I5P5_9SPHI|nr:hypothetical protein [Pedobacter sp. KR3-3]MEE1944790.1 hypothetical protein [Pedobacter sp. KR3-3]
MFKNTSKIKNVQQLSRSEQKAILGGAGGGNPPDLSKCGCDCAGRVTGPVYCAQYMACLQVYTCDDNAV